MTNTQEYRSVFNIIGTNTAQLDAEKYIVIEDLTNAQKRAESLPHNSFNLTNLDATCTLFIFLDKMEDVEKPDYVVFPNQTINANIEDGISFIHMFVKNINTLNNISANKIKYKISTLRKKV